MKNRAEVQELLEQDRWPTHNDTQHMDAVQSRMRDIDNAVKHGGYGAMAMTGGTWTLVVRPGYCHVTGYGRMDCPNVRAIIAAGLPFIDFTSVKDTRGATAELLSFWSNSARMPINERLAGLVKRGCTVLNFSPLVD